MGFIQKFRLREPGVIDTDPNAVTLRSVVDEEKKEVAAIKVRRNYLSIQRSIPEFAYLSPERMAEIAGILATAPL